MSVLITILIIIASLLLILAVLIQNPKGGGIASNFSAGNNIMGVRRTSELIEKWTWGLALGIIILTIASGAFLKQGSASDAPASDMQEQIDAAQTPPVNQNPNPANNGNPEGTEPAKP